MTWTYDGSPGTADADARRDAVRLAVGDTDSTNEQVQDEEIAYALAQRSDNIDRAAALVCRNLAARYANLTSVRMDGVNINFGERQQHYLDLATRLETQASEYGGGLGVPIVGGVSIDAMESVREDDDRPEPAFRRRQFRDPPGGDDGDYDSREEYLQ